MFIEFTDGGIYEEKSVQISYSFLDSANAFIKKMIKFVVASELSDIVISF